MSCIESGIVFDALLDLFSELGRILHLHEYYLVYLFHIGLQDLDLVRGGKSECDALIIVPACSAHTMQIDIEIYFVTLLVTLGCPDVDDEACVPYVNPSRHDVGAEQNVGLVVLELSH